ncbi:MAG: hypothetical protein GX467_02965 [Rikenellaceae bacterium]|jgi:hypothetical protein|nr:hypothetical protein [Rikenellaceae bacterium]HOF92534.1 hypothetical protein [Tenuifilaceae bacterium]
MNGFTILLNVLGIAIFYVIRLVNRSTKNKLSLKFWIKENWPELLITTLINFCVLILLLHHATDVSALLEKFVPSGMVLAGKPAAAFAVGLFASYMIYEYVNEKLK